MSTWNVGVEGKDADRFTAITSKKFAKTISMLPDFTRPSSSLNSSKKFSDATMKRRKGEGLGLGTILPTRRVTLTKFLRSQVILIPVNTWLT